MQWSERLIDELAEREHFGYGQERSSGAEPAALAALALMAHGKPDAARRAVAWLSDAQQPNGIVGVRGGLADPPWTTALALLAWRGAREKDLVAERELEPRIARATASLLSLRGKRGEHTREFVGHDATLVAWSWVDNTHSWLEPTALAVMALRAEGLGDHPRTREAVRLILDRQLATGGCNYGNTTVLGQPLRAHPQPSGMTLVALAGERPEPRIAKSVQYLRTVYPQVSSGSSLSWGVLGLAAQGAVPPDAAERLGTVYDRYTAGRCPAYIAALLALAALGPRSPLVQLPRRAAAVAEHLAPLEAHAAVENAPVESMR